MDTKTLLKNLCAKAETRDALSHRISETMPWAENPFIWWEGDGVFAMVREGEGLVSAFASRKPSLPPRILSIAHYGGQIEKVFGWILPYR